MCKICGKQHLNEVIGVNDLRMEEITGILINKMNGKNIAIPSEMVEFAMVEFLDRKELALACYLLGKTFEQMNGAIVIS